VTAIFEVLCGCVNERLGT